MTLEIESKIEENLCLAIKALQIIEKCEHCKHELLKRVMGQGESKK